jgi:hypothetical protein
MWKNLTYTQKNRVLIVAAILLLYIAYVFAFKNTVNAIQLNKQLQAEQNADHAMDSSFPQLSRKNSFYTNALKAYYVKNNDYENRLWQVLSDLAIEQKVKINFSPKPQAQTDTTTLQKGLLVQQFAFKGNYFNLVKLLDTLDKSKAIGKISTLKLMRPKDQDTKKMNGELGLQLSIVALGK